MFQSHIAFKMEKQLIALFKYQKGSGKYKKTSGSTCATRAVMAIPIAVMHAAAPFVLLIKQRRRCLKNNQKNYAIETTKERTTEHAINFE